MNRLFRRLGLLSLLCAGAAFAQDLVILHTNDTHSHIDAENDVGGVLQRKALIDSVRRAEKNVVVVDAGDIVQGTLYYKLFRGDVEYPLMDMMGYDIQILGNHEFDNGLDELAKYYKRGGAAKISANYDFSDTPLKGVFDPYVIKKIGGKKVGFMGINIKPEGIIGKENYGGLKYSDIIETANATAAKLRSLGCSAVVAVTHIGYSNDTDIPLTTDVDLAKASKGIDIIISGHSHEVVSPDTPAKPNVFNNAEGLPVVIEQTGRYGANLGYIKLDLNKATPSVKDARMIPVAGVSPSKFDKKLIKFLQPYRHDVDSINRHVIAMNAVDMINTKQYASSVLLSNFAADVLDMYASHVADSLGMTHGVDLSIINSGGIRKPMPKGEVTEGEVLSMFPFSNYVVIVEMDGRQLAGVLKQAALQKGQAVSREVLIGMNDDGTSVESILINGVPVVDDAMYRVATLDYLYGGGDYLSEFPVAKELWRDKLELCAPMMRYISAQGRAAIPINPDPRPRIVSVQKTM